MMKLMCHRPRTQQLGPDSRARNLVVQDFHNKNLAMNALSRIRIIKNKMLKAGWPWPDGNFQGFQTQPNDSFYVIERFN